MATTQRMYSAQIPQKDNPICRGIQIEITIPGMGVAALDTAAE